MSEIDRETIRKGRRIWVYRCEHCGEDTLCEMDLEMDEFCSVCAKPTEENGWVTEWIPVI